MKSQSCHGDIRETGSVQKVFSSPSDDYTKSLLLCDPARIQEKCRRLPIMSKLELKSISDPKMDKARIDTLAVPAFRSITLESTLRSSVV